MPRAVNRPRCLLGDGLLVLEGATLIDGIGTAPRERTASLWWTATESSGSAARVISIAPTRHDEETFRGHFVLPGFIDMHVHVHPKARIETVEALLDFGVTTIRSPGAAQGAGGSSSGIRSRRAGFVGRG